MSASASASQAGGSFGSFSFPPRIGDAHGRSLRAPAAPQLDRVFESESESSSGRVFESDSSPAGAAAAGVAGKPARDTGGRSGRGRGGGAAGQLLYIQVRVTPYRTTCDLPRVWRSCNGAFGTKALEPEVYMATLHYSDSCGPVPDQRCHGR